MDLATLGTVPKVRLVTNHWMMDCLYYFTKPHGQRIIDTICEQCNEAYAKHVEEFPDFISNNGQVHMMGCSLGGIAAYDILAHQWKEGDGRPPWETIEEQAYVVKKPEITVPILDFNVRFLFTCGSPVAACLVLRGLDFLYYRPPMRTKLYNVFHPFDPLGYRIEPMVNKTYVDVQPVRIHKLQRRRILPMPLPRIPNLGIKSSIAGAAPLIMRARRTFLRYMMTSEGTLIMDKNITERTVVEPTQQEADELHVQSADELPYDNSLASKNDDDDEEEETNSEGRKYDSAPEAEATPERPYMSRRISSRHKTMVRRRSHSVRDQDERIWIGADDNIGPRFVYETEEHTRTASWSETATVSDERPIWNRKWFKFDNLRRVDSGSTDGSSKTLIPVEDKLGPGTDDETRSVASTEKGSSKAASIINMAGNVATAALSAVGLKSDSPNAQETDIDGTDGKSVTQTSLDTPNNTSKEGSKKDESSLSMTAVVSKPHHRAMSAEFIRVPVEYSSIVPNLEAIATSKSPVFEGANKTSYFYDSLTSASPTDVRGPSSRDDDLNSESSYSTAIGLEVFSSPASLDRASICMTIPEDDLLDLDDAATETEELHNQLGTTDSYAADADVDDSDDDTKVAKNDSASNIECTSDEEASLNTEEKMIEGTDGKQYPRIDYVLNETVIDAYASEWIVAMKSHFKYWANRFLLAEVPSHMGLHYKLRFLADDPRNKLQSGCVLAMATTHDGGWQYNEDRPLTNLIGLRHVVSQNPGVVFITSCDWVGLVSERGGFSRKKAGQAGKGN
ncbi:hypothetical protein NQZ79_g3985 [Umbelopsis isabellina]|nr:hypothetical protein NQZ79_g3985 [Umbelopsis isabellina]